MDWSWLLLASSALALSLDLEDASAACMLRQCCCAHPRDCDNNPKTPTKGRTLSLLVRLTARLFHVTAFLGRFARLRLRELCALFSSLLFRSIDPVSAAIDGRQRSSPVKQSLLSLATNNNNQTLITLAANKQLCSQLATLQTIVLKQTNKQSIKMVRIQDQQQYYDTENEGWQSTALGVAVFGVSFGGGNAASTGSTWLLRDHKKKSNRFVL